MIETAHPLVGRGRELGALDQLLQEARAGAARFVVLSGEPGIGKTSLIAALGRRAAAAGCLALHGRATELERDFPFGLIVDALDAHLGSLDARSFDRLAADEMGELASVFPALRSVRPASSPATAAAERFRAHYATRELIERLAARRPLVLTFDDIQWSDGASVELIGHLLRHPPDAAVMLAATMRTGQAATMLAAAIEDAVRAGRATAMELGPLDRGDAARLVGATEESIALEELYRESGGNPFYLLQLARDGAHDRAVAAPDWTDVRGVPAAVRASIGRELDGLPAPARAFAQAAAVAGDPFDLDLAVPAAAMPERDALAALDELIAREILRPGDAPRRFRFRHPLVREAIYAGSPPGTRLVCHERAAAALEAQGAPAIVRAHHVACSARHGDAPAAALLTEAALEVADRAPASAAMWLQAALRILPRSAPPVERLRLVGPLATAYAATGRLEDSHNALLAAIELAAEVDVSTWVRPTAACAKIELLLGRRDDAKTRLVNALGPAAASAATLEARLLVDLAGLAYYAADHGSVRGWASRALAIAEAHEDPTLAAGALAILALAEASEGPISEARAHCSRAARLVDEMPDEALSRVFLDPLIYLCGAEYQLELFAEAQAHARRGLSLARATGRGDLFPGLSQVLSGGLFSTGRLAEATEVNDGMVDGARLSGSATGLGIGLLQRAFTLVSEGDTDGALAAAREAEALAHASAPGVAVAWVGGALGAALLESGEPERAAETIVRAGGGDELPLIPGGFRANFLEILTRSWLACGRRAQARSTAKAAQRWAQRFGLDLATAGAELAMAAVELAENDPGGAAARALAASEHAERAGAALVGARARSLAGRAFAAARETERAVTELERALETFLACGARRDAAAAERELRRLGRRVPSRARRSVSSGESIRSLTERELEVARLVVDRRTNPEIAAELFLSIKTVETHLRNIFAKLGARSRVEVARIIEHEDAATSRGPRTAGI